MNIIFGIILHVKSLCLRFHSPVRQFVHANQFRHNNCSCLKYISNCQSNLLNIHVFYLFFIKMFLMYDENWDLETPTYICIKDYLISLNKRLFYLRISLKRLFGQHSFIYNNSIHGISNNVWRFTRYVWSKTC